LNGGPVPAEQARAPSRRTILKATLIALVVAVVVLVVAVLPAEYGIDPLGAGRLLGLTSLSEAGSGALVPQNAGYKTDTMTFVLGSYEGIEYKYRLEADASLLYEWEATRTVAYDFHAEPDGAPAGYAESFDKQSAPRAQGTYTAPFPGIHGWYWENLGSGDVTVTLKTTGFYTAAIEFHGNDRFEKEF
jgi:hypothetical protein